MDAVEWRLVKLEEKATALDDRTRDMPEQIKAMREDINEVKDATKEGNRLLFQLILAVMGVAFSIIVGIAIFALTGAGH